MILELMIENFAIIDKINVRFSEGLNIITGETGTGKSIVVDAINLLLGNRADKAFIRYGEESAFVEAYFLLPEVHEIHDTFENLGIKVESDNIVTVSREIHKNGRSLSRINGRIVNLGVLRELVPNLLDIQGQNENQKLLKKDEQLKILDALTDKKAEDLRKNIRKLYGSLSELRKKLKTIDIDEFKKEREMEILSFQIEEIDNAKLKAGEDDNLLSEFRKVQKLDDIKTAVFKAVTELEGEGYKEGIVSSLYKIGSDIQSFSTEDKELKQFGDELLSLYYSAQDISRSLNEYSRSIDYSEEELETIESRIDLINNLKRKYGNTIDEIASYRDKIGQEYSALENIDIELTMINEEMDKLYNEIMDKSKVLSSSRKEKALELKDKMENEFRELNMQESVFEAVVSNREEPNETGIDDVEFMISTNIGQPLKPITKVASGGEVSRIMLAFKNIENEKNEVATLIFDEIDAGISGRTAQLVGEKILRVSEKNQIICITHLPQIAAMADHHFRISKSTVDNITTADIDELDYDQKVDELSRLTGGVSVTDSTKKHARDMLELSSKMKSKK